MGMFFGTIVLRETQKGSLALKGYGIQSNVSYVIHDNKETKEVR